MPFVLMQISVMVMVMVMIIVDYKQSPRHSQHQLSQVGNMSVGQKLPHGTEIAVDCRENYEVWDDEDDEG